MAHPVSMDVPLLVLVLALVLLLAGGPSGVGATTPVAAARAGAAADTLAYVAFVNDVHDRKLQEDPTTSTPCSESECWGWSGQQQRQRWRRVCCSVAGGVGMCFWCQRRTAQPNHQTSNSASVTLGGPV